MNRIDPKTIIGELQDTVSELTTSVNNLEKKKSNYEIDIESLSARHKVLKEKVAKLSEYLASEVVKAVDGATKRLEAAEADAKSEREALAKGRSKAGILSRDLEEKIKEAEKLKVNLKNSINAQTAKIGEANAIKVRLENIVKMIKENL